MKINLEVGEVLEITDNSPPIGRTCLVLYPIATNAFNNDVVCNASVAIRRAGGWVNLDGTESRMKFKPTHYSKISFFTNEAN